jgi:hypothetical protein
VGKPERKKHWEEKDIGEWLVLRCTLENWDEVVWAVLV